MTYESMAIALLQQALEQAKNEFNNNVQHYATMAYENAPVLATTIAATAGLYYGAKWMFGSKQKVDALAPMQHAIQDEQVGILEIVNAPVSARTLQVPADLSNALSELERKRQEKFIENYEYLTGGKFEQENEVTERKIKLSRQGARYVMQ